MKLSSRGKLTMLLVIVTGLFLGFFLWQRLQLGLVRYFDADEMAYLHWAHNVVSGKLPYIDFFLYAPPGFLYVLVPLFWVFKGIAILVAGRVFAFAVFVGIVLATMYLFWLVRRSWMALLAGVLLVFLPLPADKFLEVRPDNLAMLLVLIGLVLQVLWLQTNQKRFAFWSGFFYSASLLILPKTLPSVVMGLGIALFQKDRWRFVAGMAAPLLVFGLWIMSTIRSTGDFALIIYSLTKLPFEVGRTGEVYPILQWQFFYPNAIYYGAPGWNTSLIVNHAVWIVGLLTGVVRLMTPFVPNGKHGVWVEVLVAGMLLAHVAAFMYWYPVRHAQYFIPIAVFVAFYAADAIGKLKNIFSKTTIGHFGFAILFGALLTNLYQVGVSVNTAKMAWTNMQDIQTLREVLATIPKDSYVLDLVGSTIYYRDPYYISALPFGQYAPYLSRSFPSLISALQKTNTRFIYEGQLGRVQTLTQPDQAFITANFVADRAVPGLLIRK